MHHIIDKISLLLLCILFSMATPLWAEGDAPHIFRLLILDSQMGHPYDEVRLAMLKRLQKFGYRRSQNLQVNIFSADNDIVKGVRILQRESKRDYDVIFVGGTVATMAARQPLDGGRVPVVFGSPTDPVGIGVIKDFMTPPESNFTGVCYPVPVKARMRLFASCCRRRVHWDSSMPICHNRTAITAGLNI